jgi:hypothetical protein
VATVVFDQAPAVAGDEVTVSALVDGRRVTVGCRLSYLMALPTKAARQQYLAAALRDTAASLGPAPPVVDLSGTVTV